VRNERGWDEAAIAQRIGMRKKWLLASVWGRLFPYTQELRAMRELVRSEEKPAVERHVPVPGNDTIRQEETVAKTDENRKGPFPKVKQTLTDVELEEFYMGVDTLLASGWNRKALSVTLGYEPDTLRVVRKGKVRPGREKLEHLRQLFKEGAKPIGCYPLPAVGSTSELPPAPPPVQPDAERVTPKVEARGKSVLDLLDEARAEMQAAERAAGRAMHCLEEASKLAIPLLSKGIRDTLHDANEVRMRLVQLAGDLKVS
jgi:hypothetical protein